MQSLHRFVVALAKAVLVVDSGNLDLIRADQTFEQVDLPDQAL